MITTGSGLMLILLPSGVAPVHPLADCFMISAGAYAPGILY
jgi:hypothetical protein